LGKTNQLKFSSIMMRKIISVFRLQPDYANRVFGLDLMRALAIIIVVLEHGTLLLEKANTDFPWIPLIDGVEMFFVLSGFLIGGILIKIFEKSDSFGVNDIFNFWIRRWFRTLPNYYLVLALNIVIVYFGIIKEDFNQFSWKFFLFLQNFTQPFTGFFWESWSLSVEEWFYLLFPVVLLIVYSTMNKISRYSKKAVFLISVCIFLFIPLLLRLFIASKFEVDNFWMETRIFKVVIFRLDGIAFGLLAAFIKHQYTAIWQKWNNISFISGVILCFVILYTDWPSDSWFTKVFKILIQSMAFFLLLPKFDSMKLAPDILKRVVTHISLISYSMYLINLALVAEVIKNNFPPNEAKSAWFLYAVYWLMVVLISTLIYKYYEKPLMDLRDRFKSK